ncbi:hypothetical protein HK405_013339 [Cladochytrium tenue]|nr:hypothetical protein HK405_013339 [Cladochytrium tenue]
MANGTTVLRKLGGAALPPSAITATVMDAAIDAASSASARDLRQSPTPEIHDTNLNDNALPITLLKNVQAGNLELVKSQILEGNRIKADIENRVGPENETILHFAILRNGKIAEMIAGAASDEFLAKVYENERYFGETALHLAVVQNRPKVIDILLGCGKLDLKALATGYEFVRGTEHKGTHYAGMTALQATNEGFSPAGELGAPLALMELLSEKNKAKLTPSQMAAFYDNSGFLEAIRLNQWKFGTSSASVIKVELLSKVDPPTGQQSDPPTKIQTKPASEQQPNPPTEEQPKPTDSSNKKKKWRWRMTREWHKKTPLEIACERRSKDFAGHPFVLAIFKAKWFLPPDVLGRLQYNYLRSFFEIFLLMSTIVSLRVNARTSLWKYFFCGLVIAIFAARGVVLLSRRTLVSWATNTDLAYLSPTSNSTVDSLADGTGFALGFWLQLENFLFSAASICAWCNMLYFFKAFKSAGVLFLAFREILVDILTWSTMFVAFCLAFGGALFIQMEASDNDPWAPYWWTLVWVARVTLQSASYDDIAASATVPAIAIILYLTFSFVMLIVLVNLLIAKSTNTFDRIYDDTVKNWRVEFGSIIVDIDKSLSDSARKHYDSHIGFRDFQGTANRTPDEGRFITLVEIKAKDGVPANVVKAVVGYWDLKYELDGLNIPETTSGASSSSGANTVAATGLSRDGHQTSSGAQALSTGTNLSAGIGKALPELPRSEHTVVPIADVLSPAADVPPAAEPAAEPAALTSNWNGSQKECIDPAASPAHAREFYDEYKNLLENHMPVELHIADDYWARGLAGLWHIFAVYWAWDVFRSLIPTFMIYKKADVKLLQSDGSTSDRKRRFPQDRNLWFGHPLVIRQKRPSKDKKNEPEGSKNDENSPDDRGGKVKEYGDFALE